MRTTRVPLSCRLLCSLGVAALFIVALCSAEEFAHIAAHGWIPRHQHAAVAQSGEVGREAIGHSHSKSPGADLLFTQGQLLAVVPAAAPAAFVPERGRVLLPPGRQRRQHPPDR
ncbi:MAG: hypothetical protein HY303_00045, partial [Candidatus Wallbacteria bacterium]|nr:hypothetical protein [Candidatus Wallbacteria bacterium]